MASVLVALVGLLASGLVALRLRSGIAAERQWLVGLGAFAPAWLVEFVRMIDAAEAPTAGSRLPFVGAVGLAILGVIVTDAIVRRLGESPRRRPALVHWLLGVGALGPAWLLALLARAWVAP
jgi:hypothetical protein